jgi:mannose-6-phosphate isomerase-like protein (cupin superfamily)
MAAPETVVRLDEKFAAFDDLWTPKIVGQINDMHLKAVKVQGEFLWHVHDDTDEFFVVPMGVEHRPVAQNECEVLLLEPSGLINTGDANPGDKTAPNDDWI